MHGHDVRAARLAIGRSSSTVAIAMRRGCRISRGHWRISQRGTRACRRHRGRTPNQGRRRPGRCRDGQRTAVVAELCDSLRQRSSAPPGRSTRCRSAQLHGGCRTKVRRRGYVVGFSNGQAGPPQGAFAAPQPAVVTRPANEPPLSVSTTLGLCATASMDTSSQPVAAASHGCRSGGGSITRHQRPGLRPRRARRQRTTRARSSQMQASSA